MPFPEMMVAPVRQELARHGIRELRTPEQVDEVLGRSEGTVMVAVNSMCGCAASRMRPAVVEAVGHAAVPDELVTVFAGQDLEATARAREYFRDHPPSSPSVALLRDGEVVFMLPRDRIERRTPPEIAADLKAAFDRYCAPKSEGV